MTCVAGFIWHLSQMWPGFVLLALCSPVSRMKDALLCHVSWSYLYETDIRMYICYLANIKPDVLLPLLVC